MSESALTILHISDPHFGTEQQAVVAALLALCSREQPDVVILSGDITQRARSHQFTAAGRFFTALSAPHKLAIPGNHDIPLFNLAARMLSPYAGFRKAFGENLEPEISLPALLVIGVNTTRPGRHEDGEVSAAQVATVKARLEAAQPGQLRIVVTHQPAHVITAADCKNRLHGASEALRAWADAGADLILGGHIHLPYVRRINEDIPLLSRSLWAVQAGTAVSTRIRGGIPNSVNIIRYSPDESIRRCTVERWDHAASNAFEVVQTIPIALEPR